MTCPHCAATYPNVPIYPTLRAATEAKKGTA